MGTIQSIIIEKSLQADQDPRGVYLNGDAVRIIWSLGVRQQHFTDFAGEPESIHFYRTAISNPSGPYYVMHTNDDFLHQALPGGVTHVQPRLEASIGNLATASNYCEIRRGFTVASHEIEHDNRIVVNYQDRGGAAYTIRCNYLIGADGKRGVVRKSFLEPTTSIRQVSNPIYQYEGTWVAANLQLTLPTPETHPDFPLWKLDYSPEEVFDLFCPKAWYFCSPPGKATAGGRFGPENLRLWRHEFAQPDWNDSMDAEALFWEHFTPFITRTQDERGQRFACGGIMYPRDCINVIRCRSFTFTHKVVNRWFDRRRILIGDAAHVFPPFGGQGIASGIRDAHQLAWRISLLESMPDVDEVVVDKLLEQWAKERRRSINAATFQTKMNGQLCNESETWAFYFFRKFQAVYERLPFVPPIPNPVAEMDKKGFGKVKDGFFLWQYGGGGKFPQIFCEDHMGSITRSDDLLAGSSSLLRLVVLSKDASAISNAKQAVEAAILSPSLLNEKSVFVLDRDGQDMKDSDQYLLMRPTAYASDDNFGVRSGYRQEAFYEWLGRDTMFAILRPDFHVFALLKSVDELVDALGKLEEMLSAGKPQSRL